MTGPSSGDRPAEETCGEKALWRVGNHYGIHCYQGDRPVATFHRTEDAARAVAAVNAAQPADEQRPDDGLRQRIEALAEEWDREQAALGFVLRPIARLRRALDGDGGDRG